MFNTDVKKKPHEDYGKQLNKQMEAFSAEIYHSILINFVYISFLSKIILKCICILKSEK